MQLLNIESLIFVSLSGGRSVGITLFEITVAMDVKCSVNLLAISVGSVILELRVSKDNMSVDLFLFFLVAVLRVFHVWRELLECFLSCFSKCNFFYLAYNFVVQVTVG